MPIYEYECTDCGHQFEALVQRGKKPTCPECKGKKLDKLISASATHSRSSQSCAVKKAGACHETGCGGCCHRG